MKEFVVTLVCEDRPGLVELVSETIAQNFGSWDESSMARLSGMFAGILHVHVDQAHADALTTSLKALKNQGLTLILSPVAEPVQMAETDSAIHLTLALTGHDKPGIIQQVSRLLAERSINVEKLETRLSSSSMSGAPMFTAQAKLIAPANLDLDDLQQVLEDQASDLMVDIELQAAD